MRDIRALGSLAAIASLGVARCFANGGGDYLVGEHVPNNGTTYAFPPEKLSKRAKRRLRGKAKARP